MGNEVMARLGARPKRRFEDKAAKLAGGNRAAQLAMEHTLLWREWKSLLKQQTQSDADVIAVHRRMAALDAEMREVLASFESAIQRAERQVERKVENGI